MMVPGISSRDPVILCLSHLRWDFVFQRPHHILTRAANTYRVYFVEEPVTADSGAKQRVRFEQRGGVTVVVPVLPPVITPGEAADAQRGIIDRIMRGHRGAPIILWYYTPMALAFSDHLTPDLCVYDCMDELSAFLGAPSAMTSFETRLFGRADLVFTGGPSLYEAKRRWHLDVHAFPSSIDRAHFAVARDRQLREPPDQAPVAHPRVGYFGVIDERMDLDLVARLAAIRPEWHFVFLGPVAKIDPALLPKAANLYWLGPKRYEDLPAYLQGWDAGIMPFALNAATRYISPTKTPEYLAAGVPVVSTPIRDVIALYGDQGLVEIAATAETMATAVERYLKRDRAPWRSAIDRKLDGQSWDRTWAAMNALITRRLRPSAAAVVAPVRHAPPRPVEV
jgi:glycosyltransferase involved in cell wall biosynthesis